MTRTIARNIKTAMVAAEVTPAQLAERAGLDESGLRRMLRAEREPRIDTLIKIADSLRVPADDLTAGLGFPAKQKGKE